MPPVAYPLSREVRHPAGRAAAANDDQADPSGDPLLRAALRLSAAHGLSAARRAHRACEQAYFAGDRNGYRWWLALTHVLDRMLAAELALDPPAVWRGARPRG